MDGFSDLPAGVQAIISIATGIGTAVWVVFGYTKKKVAALTDSQESKDAVVISAAFADKSVIDKLDRTVDELAVAVQELRHSTDRNTTATENQTGVMADRLNRIGDLLANLRLNQ